MSTKARLTVTVDPDVVRAGDRAVSEGRAGSLSAWVNAALVERAARDRHLRALARAVADYEAEFGAISDQELALQRRLDQSNARVVRSGGRATRGRSRRGGAR